MFKCTKQVGAVVRLVGLLAVAVLVGLAVWGQQPQQLAQAVTDIKIVPENPTPKDEITIELSGTFPTGCAPDSATAQVELNQVTIETSNVSEFCAEGETKWSLSVPVGKKLEAGPYRVLVLFRMTKEPPDFLLGMARFDVAEKSGSADQAGQPSPLVPFTILPVVQTLDQSRVVPSGAFKIATINTSKSNVFRVGDGGLSLPATGGVTKGDVVTLATINTSKSQVFRVTGCQAQDAQIVDDCTRPPIKEIKLEITGENPILELLIEQTELPDLAVSITANVRRYTEMEQVFCDVTVRTRVSNVGKGPSGAVALANNLNSSKANLNRYGMGGGDSATQTDLLIRLRPGSYPLEAEVQSLSIKESTTANNKARQVVVCR